MNSSLSAPPGAYKLPFDGAHVRTAVDEDASTWPGSDYIRNGIANRPNDGGATFNVMLGLYKDRRDNPGGCAWCCEIVMARVCESGSFL